MNTYKILDAVLPYTPEDRRCGTKKAAKIRARVRLAEQIASYRQGLPIKLDPEVIELIGKMLVS